MARPKQCRCVPLKELHSFKLTEDALNIIPHAVNYTCVKKPKNLFFSKMVIDKMENDFVPTNILYRFISRLSIIYNLINFQLLLLQKNNGWLLLQKRSLLKKIERHSLNSV